MKETVLVSEKRPEMQGLFCTQILRSVEVVDFCGKELRVLRRLRHPYL